MRVLVTGGAAYVGSVSVEALVAAGHEVVVLDDLSTGHRTADLGGSRLVAGTYGDRAAVARILTAERIEAVLHCAARSIVAEAIADPARYYEDNVVGGIAVLDGVRHAGVGRVLVSPTAAGYGCPDRVPIAQTRQLAPRN